MEAVMETGSGRNVIKLELDVHALSKQESTSVLCKLLLGILYFLGK